MSKLAAFFTFDLNGTGFFGSDKLCRFQKFFFALRESFSLTNNDSDFLYSDFALCFAELNFRADG